ncbi:ArsC family reductase [Marinobacterium sediminicola]|uniref:Transcriptional regulator, Spx/MgsR family n=1 Tax=Marinobacterium sediminicola TaxID=518898 RepID=A0ABY1S1B4_9GAMM|nr:ArsC family reductase [Marinobacterium sediminicola]ULG69796.1 ArsC family reductase [Marinobacterium sediminicola]SMR75390.1 transcriptional regulator, Spx/MgsR family [Marinobacterium sediminicola]
MTIIYGISNCDTVRKARKWLEAEAVAFDFHDFRKQGLSAEQVDRWCAAVGLDTLLNKRGTTWRQLPDEVKANTDEAALKALLVEQPTLIKRPVLELDDGRIEIGFKAEQYAAAFDR